MSRLALIFVLLQAAAVLSFAYPSSPDPPHPSRPQSTNQTPAAPGNTSPGAPVNASPAAPAASVDPAAAIFSKSATAGLLLVTVKADKVADYEEVIRALQEGLSRSTDAGQQALARGWRVFKADTDPKANAIYVHFIDPVVPQADYRPSRVLDDLVSGASAEMLAKYRDAIVGAPAMLGMHEFANMATTPVARPANASPEGPAGPKKPGG